MNVIFCTIIQYTTNNDKHKMSIEWWSIMFINKTADGRNNLCGRNVAVYRKDLGISQRVLADRLQISGLDIDKNAVQRIESGQRFVTDIELKALAAVFHKSLDAMLETGS